MEEYRSSKHSEPIVTISLTFGNYYERGRGVLLSLEEIKTKLQRGAIIRGLTTEPKDEQGLAIKGDIFIREVTYLFRRKVANNHVAYKVVFVPHEHNIPPYSRIYQFNMMDVRQVEQLKLWVNSLKAKEPSKSFFWTEINKSYDNYAELAQNYNRLGGN